MSTFDRHPYLKHSTAMPAHKDTQHPAGQVVNQDEGQHTLAAYVRSINRAQAFDDVAQEKKISFDKWYSDYFGKDLEEDMFSHRVMLLSCWNAALLYGKVS